MLQARFEEWHHSCGQFGWLFELDKVTAIRNFDYFRSREMCSSCGGYCAAVRTILLAPECNARNIQLRIRSALAPILQHRSKGIGSARLKGRYARM